MREIMRGSKRRYVWNWSKRVLASLLFLLTIFAANLALVQPTSALPTLALPSSGIYDGKSQMYYNGMVFSGPHTVQEGDSLSKQADGFNYNPGDVYYLYVRPSDKPSTTAYIIVVDSKDNPANGQYSEYTFDTTAKTYSGRHNTNNITINKGNLPTVRNCNIEWVGWIVCPISNALASALDDLYNIVSSSLKVPAIDGTSNFATGQPKPIYGTWSIVRNISNLVFIALLLLVIISHVTGFGLSAYSVRKIFPKLIVTAVLVNISLTICTLLVDVFNILGHSVVEIFEKVQMSLGSESELSAISAVNWTALLASAYGAGTLALALNGGVIGSTLLLLGSMAGAFAMIVAVVVALSARHAVIVILTILSPLAFVLNLLPNTEQWFSKWWKAFIKILAIFPLFGLIYGASQLASYIIIQTANNSFILILVGLIIKIVPFGLLLTIIKSSDAIMDRITKSAENRTRSLGESMEDFFHRKQEIAKTQYETGVSTGLRRLSPRGLAQSMDRGRRRDTARLRAVKARQEAAYSEHSSQLDPTNSRPANVDAKVEFDSRAAEASASAFKTKLDASFNTMSAKVEAELVIKNGNRAVGLNRLSGFHTEAEMDIAQASLVKQISEANMESMKFMRVENQSKLVTSNLTVPDELGYGTAVKIRDAMSGINEKYQGHLLSQVIATERKEKETAMENAKSLINSLNLSNAEKMALATHGGYDASFFAKLQAKNTDGIEKVDAYGQTYTLRFDDETIRSAAANIMGNIPRGDIHEALQLAAVEGGLLFNDREMLSQLIHKSGVGKNMMMGIKTDDYVNRGLFRGVDTYYEGLIENIVKGRYSLDKIIAQDKDAMVRMVQGLELMNKNATIRLAELNDNGQIESVNMIQHVINMSKTPAIARQNLETFKNNLKDVMANEHTKHQLQPVQIQNIQKMLANVNSIMSQIN